MVQNGSVSVLERKVAAAEEADAGSGRSVLRALRLALARSAKDLFDLPLAVIGAKQARCEQARLTEFLSDNSLLVLLDGSQGLAGAVSLDRDCVAALIQQQTMGQVSGASETDRRFTGTDAALAEPLIETMLTRAAELAESPRDQTCLTGFRFGARFEDARSLLLALEADRFRVFDLTLDFSEGASQGHICLMLPDLPAKSEHADSKAKGTVFEGPQMGMAFGAASADLTAVIARLRLSVTELTEMRPGDVLPLMPERLEETELVAINGRPMALGRLGQFNGLRALRLNETVVLPSPDAQLPSDGFAEQVLAPPSEKGSLVVSDEAAISLAMENTPVSAGALAVINKDGNVDTADETGDAALDPLGQMTPEEAAIEISQLAGLQAED